MDKKGNFLALCLLDALEDENFKISEQLILKLGANPNTIVMDRGIAPIHYACGMDNIKFAEKITELMLANGGDPNVQSEDNMTPLHVAAIWGRANIVRMLLNKGGDINAVDVEKKTPILYAVYECQFDVVKIIQNYVFEKKINEKKRELIISANKINLPSNSETNNLSVNNIEERKYTPNRINYNFDETSPYYINITHRRKNIPMESSPKTDSTVKPSLPKVEKKQDNLFKLTQENLSEYSKNMSPADKSKISFIKTWREKVQRSKNRKSMVNKFNDIDALLSGLMTEESMDFTNTILNLDGEDEFEKQPPKKAFDFTSFGKLLKRLRAGLDPEGTDDSFVTADDNLAGGLQANESNFIRTPKNDSYFVQMTEEYVHTDDENGLVFYEKRLLGNAAAKGPSSRKSVLNKTQSSDQSTDFSVPLDYDTEDLKAELTNYGEPPGPITKSTKRLYTKRLIKYKRNPEKTFALANINDPDKKPSFSVELQRTIGNKNWFIRIPEYMDLEKKMCLQFNESKDGKRSTWREGHLKMSFIYLLIDPRISDNLPGQCGFLEKHDVWKKFLTSIFYVGKGKTVRPYSHLYDAMKLFCRSNPSEKINPINQVNKENNTSKIQSYLLDKSPKKSATDSKKINRILDIWKSGKGVVCLHIFHNILPAEAYTREAAIIEALGLQHLTNCKRGDYYGCAQSWDMRTRKFLGIALLFKAMKIYLAEGESQLSPSDLI